MITARGIRQGVGNDNQFARFLGQQRWRQKKSKRDHRAFGNAPWKQERKTPGLLEADVLDDFEAAAIRLKELLHDDEFQEEERSLQEISQAGAVDRCSKRLLYCVAASLLGAYTCQLLNQPLTGLGAVSLWEHSVNLACGVAIASPIAALKWLSWSPEAHDELPSMKAIHERYEANVPEMAALSRFQAILYYPAEIIRYTIFQIPLLQACLYWPLTTYTSRLQEWGWWLPDSLPVVSSVVISASLASFLKLANFAPPVDQFVSVQSAVDNSDDYYRLRSAAIGQKSRDATKMSDAFKATATAWLIETLTSAALTSILAAFEVVLISGLWQGTHDVVAPLTAAVLIYGADSLGAYTSINEKKTKI